MKSIAITIILSALIAGALSIYNLYNTIKVVKATEKEEWCEVAKIGPDGKINYSSQAQQEELIVMATANGPVLMAKCK